MASDTKRGGGNPGKNSRQRIKFSHYAAAHQCEHAAKDRARRPPGEGVDGAQRTDPTGKPGGAGNSRCASKVMDHQGYILQVELFDDLGGRAGSALQIDFSPGQTLALPRPRSIETYAAKILAQAPHDVAPDEG